MSVLIRAVQSEESGSDSVRQDKCSEGTNIQGDDDSDEIESEPNLRFDMDETSLVSRTRNRKKCFECGDKISLYKGLTYAFISCIFFSLCAVIVRYLQLVYPGELACLRFLGIFIFSLPLVINNHQNFFGNSKERFFLVVRGILGSTSLFLRFIAFHYLPIAEASVIVFSVPVFVSIFARIFLKEPCGLFQVITVLLTMTGVLLITKLPIIRQYSSVDIPPSIRLYGVGAALISTVFASGVYIVLRKMKKIHHSVILFNFGWVGVIVTALSTAVFGNFSWPPCGIGQFLGVALGLFSFLGQIFFTKALQIEQAGFVSIVRAAADIIFAFLWQVLFFKEIPDVWSISGAIIVSICVLITSARKWFASLPPYSPLKKKLAFLIL
ncbi:solute carrier family 35 member G1-like [Tachypleus tridentatus]|uniref:solute carrier family 35 member G1-like n=1 Tax=Tachypleus tridentatus TaxID=6853 RepID=UPI003FD03656